MDGLYVFGHFDRSHVVAAPCADVAVEEGEGGSGDGYPALVWVGDPVIFHKVVEDIVGEEALESLTFWSEWRHCVDWAGRRLKIVQMFGGSGLDILDWNFVFGWGKSVERLPIHHGRVSIILW